MSSRFKRILDTPRLKSFAGYAARPVVQDSLSYFIPAFHVISSRLVAFRNQLFEIWSPNSTQTPFYPGVQDSTVHLTTTALPESQRRCDGHMGRFDPTISPQHYNPQYPWLPFIRRYSDGSHPEHEAFLTVWRPTSSPNRGTIHLPYLQQLASRSQLLLDAIAKYAAIQHLRPKMWEHRQLGPSPHDIMYQLGGERTFDHAVDYLNMAQRDLKVMSAWIRMAHLIIEDSRSNLPPITSVPEADDSLVGIWLNGTTEEVGLWLLQHGVPCFIIHEAEKPADLRRLMQNSDRLHNFWQNTPVASLCFDVNPVDVAVSRDRGMLRDLETDIGLATQAPDADTRDRDRSSPYAQGFVNGQYHDPRIPTPSRYAPPAITLVDGMIIPPPVASAKPGIKWSRWISQTNDEDEEYLSQIGKRSEEGGSYKYYDREKCRSFLLDHRLKAPEHYFADPAIYGLPAPRVRYYEPGNKDLYERAGSHWVYLQKEPKREDIGRKYTPPASTSAPIPARDSTGDEDELDWSDSPILGHVPLPAEMQVVPSLPLQPSSPRSPHSPPRSRSGSSSWRSRSPSRRNCAQPPPFPQSCLPSACVHLSSPPRRPRPRSPSPYMPRGRRRSSPELRRSSPERRRSSPECRRSSPGCRRSSPRRRRFSPRRHFPSHRQIRPLPREAWRVDGSENSSPVAGPSRLGGMNDGSVPDVTEPFSGGPFASPRLMVDSSEQWEMDVSEEPSVGGVTDAIEPPSSGPSLPLAARFSEVPPIVANPPVDRESRRMDAAEDPALPIVPFGGTNDDIAKSSVIDAIEPFPTGPSLPLIARLSKAPSIAANPPVDKERMLALFPVPTSTDIPFNSVISASSQSRFLLIWNLPGHFVWHDVVSWLERSIAYLGKPKPVLQRVARTNQRGDQAFWLKFTTVSGASAFRGMVAGRQAADTPPIQCDYVEGDQYSAALSRSSDSWTPEHGFMGDISPTAPFPPASVTEMNAPPLADRLTPFRRRTHRGKKKKVKKPEDMQM